MRLQGFEPGGPKNPGSGCRTILPGGGAGPDASPLEKVYVVLAGELTVIVGGRETVLGHGFLHDSAGEIREAVNRGNDMCTMLVVMPYPPGAAP